MIYDRELFIDVETYSSADIKACGAYKYIASPDFEILICSYAFGDDEVVTIDLAQGDEWPEEFIEALHDPLCLKVAHNAVFERRCFERIGIHTEISEWYCTSVKAAYCGLPLSLDEVSKRLDLVDKKLSTGKALIKYFSCPCKPTKVNGGRTRNYPSNAPDKWAMYKEYNVYDVLSEREIYRKLEKYEIPDIERQIYVVDQRINDRGIMIDRELAESAIYVDTVYRDVLTKEAQHITHLENPNSPIQMRKWIERVTGLQINSLAKDVIADVIEQTKSFPQVAEALNIYRKLSKTSVKKYYAMINCSTSDDRVRGTFQFYGANRTGRWAGRLLQLQNLSKNHFDNIDLPRDLIRARDWETVDMLYGDVSDVLSQLVRTALIAPEGYIYSVADFSAIEARVISWLANEHWRMEVFRGDGKIYEATGSKMFGVPISAITKGSVLRDKSKISELALGYEGSLGALKRMGGEKMGLADAEMMSLVKKWRNANPAIVSMWKEIERCAHEAVRYHRKVRGTCRNLIFDCDGTYLTIMLPSGRKLFYSNPHFKDKKIGRSTMPTKVLCYDGIIQETKHWGETDTYGGKLTENIVQAIARDLIGYSMMQLEKAGYRIVAHIHDECIAEVPKDGKEQQYYDMMAALMATPPDWAMDLPLRADGYLTPYYKKD
jgi:DNA polymerase